MNTPLERIYANRYLLDVQLPNTTHDNCWRAYDQTLNRWVTLNLLNSNDERAQALIDSCEHAAAIESRGAIGILDVIHSAALNWPGNIDPDASYVGIVTQWAQGTSLAEYLQHNDDALPIVQALKILRGIAMTVASAHQQGVVHGNIAASNIVFVDSGETRIQGFGIDHILLNSDVTSSIAGDIAASGALLHFMLTQYGLEQAQARTSHVTDHRMLPSQLRSGIPASLDELYRSTQDGTCRSMQDFVEALSIELSLLTDSRESPSPSAIRTDRTTDVTPARRWLSVLIASLAVCLLAWGGWQLMTHNFKPGGVPVALLPENFADDPLASMSATPTASVSASVRLANLTTIRDFDPKGNGQENPDLVSKAIDKDSATAWTTVEYRGADLAGKPGVGLLLDLGQTSNVGSVNVDFSSAGQDLAIYVSGSETPALKPAELLGKVKNSGISSNITGKAPHSGRYVVVWLTRLPQVVAGTYQTGITEIQVGLS